MSEVRPPSFFTKPTDNAKTLDIGLVGLRCRAALIIVSGLRGSAALPLHGKISVPDSGLGLDSGKIDRSEFADPQNTLFFRTFAFTLPRRLKDMALKIFNTLSRSLQEFEPLDPNRKQVGMYCCGPTVYDLAHIGNFRTFVFTDLVRRYLEFKGFAVRHVMNITDVEDKIITRVREAQVPLR